VESLQLRPHPRKPCAASTVQSPKTPSDKRTGRTRGPNGNDLGRDSLDQDGASYQVSQEDEQEGQGCRSNPLKKGRSV
jgi:hypothetical protein